MKGIDYDGLLYACKRCEGALFLLLAKCRMLATAYPEGIAAALTDEQRAELDGISERQERMDEQFAKLMGYEEPTHEQAESGK